MVEQFALDSPASVILAEAADDPGLTADWREHMRVAGAEDWPSCYPVTDLAVASIGAAGVALSDLLTIAGERSSPITIDRHFASAWFRSSLLPIDCSLPPAWDAIAGDYWNADGWIRLHTNAPHHRDAMLQVLRCEAARELSQGGFPVWRERRWKRRHRGGRLRSADAIACRRAGTSAIVGRLR